MEAISSDSDDSRLSNVMEEGDSQSPKLKYNKNRASKDAFLKMLYTNHSEPQILLKDLIDDMLENKRFIDYDREDWPPFFRGFKHLSDVIVKKYDVIERDFKQAKALADRLATEKTELGTRIKAE